jgi:hypothetical protein
VSYFDTLRPPALFDPTAPAYKDWLHLNILDHTTGAVGLINVSLHGAPYDARSLAVGAALVYIPGAGWVGNIETHPFQEAEIGASAIGLERVALSLDPAGKRVLGSVRDRANRLEVRASATAAAAPIIVEQKLPFGSGWISWYAMPRLALSGDWMIGDLTRDLAGASAYQDHNWGRWHWGDDVGWEWGSFLAPSPGPVFVFSRATNRDHTRCGEPSIAVRAGEQRHTFTGAVIQFEYSGQLDTALRRVPGAMAALHQDRAQPRLPKHVNLHADDGVNQLELQFTAQAAAQVIVADPMKRGYGFIHEIPGVFWSSGRIGRTDVTTQGLAIFEYVD